MFSHFGRRSFRIASSLHDCVVPGFVTCWKCKKPILLPQGTALFWCPCEENMILPPTSGNFFNIFQCPEEYTINMVRLKNIYVELQKQLHPDKFSNRSQVELEFSSQQSALVNEAYGTLSTPYHRGIYLLELRGFSINEDENTSAGDNQFLEGIMKLNESVAGCSNDQDSELLKSQIEAFMEDYIRMLTIQFDEGRYLEAKETLKKMKYYINIKEKLHCLLP